MLCIPWMVILRGHNIKKKKEFSIFELPRVKNYISRLCTGPFSSRDLAHTQTREPWVSGSLEHISHVSRPREPIVGSPL